MIFTFFADVPVIPLVDREKVLGVCLDANLEHSIQHINELTRGKVMEWVSADAAIRATMRSYLKKVRNLKTDIKG
ncbi:MAG: hypothetical protein HC845_00110 [Akkermansiaceae bacterium]|nr:hypothetical protein [Akkermansiaceae bacterium]